MDGRSGSALEEVGRERVARDLQMLCHIGEDGGEGADAETRVIGDGEVMLAALLRGEPEVAPGFPRHGVSVSAEGPGEIAAGEIAGEPHR